jgi:hypothetical protein
VEGLVRPVEVVLGDEPVDRRLRRLQRGERTAVVEQLAAQGEVESLDLPGRGRRRRLVSRCVMPFSRQILSNNTSPPLPNRSVNCLPLSS